MEIIFDDKHGSVGLPNIVTEKGHNEKRNSEVACEANPHPNTNPPHPLGVPLIVRASSV